ncbi:MAG: polyphosphate kinase 1 [Pyrinomonadaceae bacterium]|nr:polyphosphate kinase 1 [Pyrinomonadaceae bacterium]
MSQAAQEFVLNEQIELPESLLHDQRFLFNRELSWLEFNRRVLEEALDQTNPLLERLKFLSIFSTNLDEFFMIRVSGLKEQIAENVSELSPDGLSAGEQMREIRAKLRPMLGAQMQCLEDEVFPQLTENGVEIVEYAALNEVEKQKINQYFLKNVFPILTPQAVDSSHPFPYISNLSLNIGLMVEPDKTKSEGKLKRLFTEPRFARIKLPPNVPRLIPIDENGVRFTLLEEIISANIQYLFPNMITGKCFLFRVTRDADIELREDEAGDLLRTMEEELHRRRFSFAVRLEVADSMPDEMAHSLAGSIGLTEQDVYRINGFLNIPDLMRLYSLDRSELKDKPISYLVPQDLRRSKNIFDVLKNQDILLHHPYTAYSTVTDFINAAADDDDVVAIKICLYRTGKDSPIVKALMQASENGKQVAALVELKARFDEENNIEWARRLENEGVHVIYGIRGLKTHSKVTLVVRREGESLKRYVHLATGNYNPTTSRIYTDIGFLTTDEEIGADATDLFNFLTGYSQQMNYRKLLVAPVNLREKMIYLIKRETENAKQGKFAHIIAKINSLTDVETIHELYKASQAGVKIDLIIRGICVLRPEIPGLSENIRVISIVGRFLEHSRIFYFGNGGDEEVYFGSADWMQRNLNRRVEVIAPVKDKKFKQLIKENILAAYLKDNINSQILHADGTYEKIQPTSEDEKFDSQVYFVGMEFEKG